MKKLSPLNFVIVASLLALDIFFWFTIVSRQVLSAGSTAHDYFLDVGQGDSELIIFPGGVKVMTDAGPITKILDSLEKVLSPDDHYIDIAIISHPQLDHFNGYNFMLDNGYSFGVFVYNGRDDTPGVNEWPELTRKIKEKKIPLITLGAEDKITVNGGPGNGKSEIDLFSPNVEFNGSAELNDTGFVELIKTPSLRTLLTADTGFNVENWLLTQTKLGMDLRADVLKIGHHGSKYSSGNEFLLVVAPKVAVTEVGAKNTYGHPAKETLARIASSTNATVFRTDKNGTVEIWSEDGKLRVKRDIIDVK